MEYYLKTKGTGLHGRLRFDMTKNQCWLYGVNPVTEALKSGRNVKSIYISNQRQEQIRKIINIAEVKGISINFVEKEFFDSRFDKGHQGIAAIIEKRAFLSIEELLKIPSDKCESPFFLVLDGIEDPRNFGAILRVADSTGIHGVVFQSRRSVGLSESVSKSSAGASEYVNLVEVVNIKHAIKKMKETNINIIGAEADAEQTIWDVDMRVPLAFVVGSEGKGLRRTVKEMCDLNVKIPMKGNVNSLNVSVATGILAYEVLRQRYS